MAGKVKYPKNRTAALKTERALAHHAKKLAPVKRALQDSLHFSGIMHKFVSIRGGANSWRLVLADGRNFEVRGYPAGTAHISIRQYGSIKPIRLENERDAIRFVEGL